MANLSEIERALIDLQQQVINIQNNTIPVPDFALEVNDAFVKAGSKVFGTKAGINGGGWFFGTVTVAPPTQDSHIDFDVQQ